MVKEVLALVYALGSLGSCISNKRISAQVDNMALIHAWEGQYSKNADLNKALKSNFQGGVSEQCVVNSHIYLLC